MSDKAIVGAEIFRILQLKRLSIKHLIYLSPFKGLTHFMKGPVSTKENFLGQENFFCFEPISCASKENFAECKLAHSIGNKSWATPQCNTVPYLYAVYWLRIRQIVSSAFLLIRKCNWLADIKVMTCEMRHAWTRLKLSFSGLIIFAESIFIIINDDIKILLLLVEPTMSLLLIRD